jgi:hypothetical protein
MRMQVFNWRHNLMIIGFIKSILEDRKMPLGYHLYRLEGGGNMDLRSNYDILSTDFEGTIQDSSPSLSLPLFSLYLCCNSRVSVLPTCFVSYEFFYSKASCVFGLNPFLC